MATSNGALTLAQGANAITAAAGVIVVGILSPQNLDAETGSPLLADSSGLALFADGTPNYAQGAQTINAAAAIPVIGEIAEAQAAQTINAQASVTAAGALEATQAPNSLHQHGGRGVWRHARPDTGQRQPDRLGRFSGGRQPIHHPRGSNPLGGRRPD